MNYPRAIQLIGEILRATGRVPAMIATQKIDPHGHTSIPYYVPVPDKQPTLDFGEHPQHRETRTKTHQVRWDSIGWADVVHDGQGAYRLHHSAQMWLFWDFGDDGFVIEAEPGGRSP